MTARAATAIVALWSTVLAAVILAPLLSGGYLLLRDAVATPRSYLTDSALGVGDAAPRAVPQDAAIAAASRFVDGGLLVTGLTLAGLIAAGLGAALLARRILADVIAGSGLPAMLVAATVAVWNPYVAERLLQGHWSLLVGYGMLPWTVLAVMAAARAGSTRERVGAIAGVAACLGIAGLTPTGVVLATVIALVTAAAVGRGGERLRWATLIVVGAAVAASPWVIAGLGAQSSADPSGAAAFAARAEPWLGTIGSLAGLGGIWNSAAVPGSRSTGWAAVATALLALIVAAGMWRASTRLTGPHRRAAVALFMLAVTAVVVIALAATGPGTRLVAALGDTVPGAGLFRDGQKWMALAMPGYAVAAAALVTMARRTVLVGAAVLVAVIAPLPDLAFGVGAQVRAVHYPDDWATVAAAIDGPGAVVVLPEGMFRRFPYSGEAPVLDPAPRMLPNDVVQTGDLPVGGTTVLGEGARARQIYDAAAAGQSAELARLGVGWVLIENTADPGAAPLPAFDPPLTTVVDTPELTLLRVDEPVVFPRSRTTAVVAHLIWAALIVGGILVALGARLLPVRAGRPGPVRPSEPGRS